MMAVAFNPIVKGKGYTLWVGEVDFQVARVHSNTYSWLLSSFI